MDNKKLWQKVLDNIKQEVSAANFKTWFSATSLSLVDDNKVTITAPSVFIKEQLRLRYINLLTGIFNKELSKEISIEIVVKQSQQPKKAYFEPKFNDEETFFKPQIQNPILNPKFTLENFVVGLSNNVAYAAAQAVIADPGIAYNPLLIYGGTGVGKTHLMLAIGNALIRKNPNLKVIYCSSEKFMNDYVEAIQIHKMGDFRSKYRSANILLIDDIQFFSGREGTQEEFFHTFNELQSQNSQMVLTSDRSPNEIAKLEDRLKSRFQGGLMVDMQPPDFDTRVAIIRAKCLERGESLPEESLRLIAQTLSTNTREIEGKLIQILQSLRAQNLAPTVENINLYLDQKPIEEKLKVDHRQVLNIICSYFDLKISDLTGPKRNKELVLPRHIAMHILSDKLNLTVERIGQLLGGRDHTTVMHGRDKIKRLINTDREVQRIFIEVSQRLKN